MTEVKNEKMNRVTVHLDEKPIYDIVMTKIFRYFRVKSKNFPFQTAVSAS